MSQFSQTVVYLLLMKSYWFVCLMLSFTHWGRMTHICVSKLTLTGSDNGLAPTRRQAIIRTNVGIFLIWPLRTNFNEIGIKIHTFSFKEIRFKMSSGKWRPFCLSLNVLTCNSDLWKRYEWHNEGHSVWIHHTMACFFVILFCCIRCI